MLDVVLKPGRDRSVRRRHPWVMSGAVDAVRGGEGEPGAAARVISAEGETLAFGHYSPGSSLRVRLLAFGEQEPGDDLVPRRIAAAIEQRRGDPLLADTDAVRLVNAEGDGLPGLVVDLYGGVAVVQLTSAGMAARRSAIAAALRVATGARHGFERSDPVAARREGAEPGKGALWGTDPPASVPIHERDCRFEVDPVRGQKTGFYLDQRDARALVSKLALGRRVLDLFSYTGGFAVAAARGGAQDVTLVESSAPAVERATAHLETNAPECDARVRRADVFRFLRGHDEQYGLVIVDPPPLARHKGDVGKAARAYKDVLLHALRRASPGARVLAFSCSHHVGPDLFRKIAFGASLDADRPLQILAELGAPSDHPTSIDHPEGRYLTGLLLGA